MNEINCMVLGYYLIYSINTYKRISYYKDDTGSGNGSITFLYHQNLYSDMFR